MMKLSSLRTLILVGLSLAFAQVAAAQIAADEMQMFKLKPALRGRSLGHTAHPASKPSAAYLTDLRNDDSPSGNCGGPNCPLAADLRAMVDNYLATPNPNFPGLGPTVPGASVSVSSPACGTFIYAAGLSNVEQNKRLTQMTRMQLGSMTKAIVAAVTLRLSEMGAFGRRGLGTPVKDLLTPKQIKALTVGDDPSKPRCPGSTYLLNRDTGVPEWTAFACPDLSRVTLRDLMRANHGMYDIVNEVFLPNGGLQWFEGTLIDLFHFAGIDAAPPVNAKNGYDALKAYGLKRNMSAVVGGSSPHDFESSLGNTGFELLGVILEQKTGKSLDDLVRTLIVRPLKLDSIELYLDPDGQGSYTARGYDVLDGIDILSFDGIRNLNGYPSIEQSGAYPIVNLNGHTALDSLSLGHGHPSNFNFAGGAGALVANPKSYRVFLEAFTHSGLLGPVAQRELDDSYIAIPGFGAPPILTFLNGFGLIKLQFRGFPGIADSDQLFHGGSLSGGLCDDRAVYAADSNILLGTVALCQNSNLNAFPNIDDLVSTFAAILNPP